MKQFLDFYRWWSSLPFMLYDIYAATTALIVATAVVLIYSWVRYRKWKNGADHLRAGGRLRRLTHLLP